MNENFAPELETTEGVAQDYLSDSRHLLRKWKANLSGCSTSFWDNFSTFYEHMHTMFGDAENVIRQLVTDIRLRDSRIRRQRREIRRLHARIRDLTQGGHTLFLDATDE